MKEKLAELKGNWQDYVKIIQSTNAHSVKKYDKTRKGYKKDTAIKDVRLLMSDVTIKMWEQFQFDCAYEDGPSFGDLKRASGFGRCKDVHNCFKKSAEGKVTKDAVKESLTEKE